MWKERKKVFSFLFLAFVIPLVCIVFMRYCSVFQTGIGNLLLYGIEGASPTIAAFIVVGRNEGIKSFLKKKIKDNFSIRICFLGMIIPLLILTMGKIISYFALAQDVFFHSLSMKKLLIISWALWHYHFMLGGTMQIPYLAFLCGCILESYGYFVLVKIAKGNIVPACLWHFTGNLFFNLYRIDPSWNHGNMIPYHIVNVMYCFYIMAFLLYKKKRE